MSKSYNLRTAFWRRMMYLQFKPKMKNIEQVEGLLKVQQKQGILVWKQFLNVI